jgi:MinD-like ATPase involved in chromosome partitioning or flagellar assembly
MDPRIIAITSVNAGNGKTTTALNLGLAFHTLGEKTIVIDADFSKPNMVDHLNINTLSKKVQDVFLGKNSILDSIYTHPSGLKMIPSPNIHDYDRLSHHLQDLLPEYNYIIMDTGEMDTGETPFIKMPEQSLNEALIVHSPKHSSKYVADAAKILKDNHISLLGVLMNKSKNSSNSMLNIPILANIPEHKHVYKSYVMKNPLLYTNPSSMVSKKFIYLAKLLR